MSPCTHTTYQRRCRGCRLYLRNRKYRAKHGGNLVEQIGPVDGWLTVENGAGGIGDGLLGLAAALGLMAENPGMQVRYRCGEIAIPFVDLFESPGEVCENSRSHNEYLLPDARQMNAGFSEEQSGRYHTSRIARYCKSIGAKSPVMPRLREPDRLRTIGKQHEGVVFLCLQSTDTKRTMPSAEMTAIEQTLHNRGYKTVSIIDEWPVDELAGGFLNAACVVGVDSGLAHLSAMIGCPTVVLGGHIPVGRVFDFYPAARCIQGPLPCTACCGLSFVSDRCKTECGSLAAINPARVLAAVDACVVPFISGGHSLLSPDRLAVIRDAVLATNHLPGDCAELGVYRGGVAKLIAHYAPATTLHLFDTFTGIPSDDEAQGGHHKAGEFACNIEDVLVFLDGLHTKFHVGEFPGTVPTSETHYRLVHVDGDTYQTTRDAINYFVPRMVRGGVMIFDDYGWHHCPGVKRAIEEAGLKIETPAQNQAVFRSR